MSETIRVINRDNKTYFRANAETLEAETTAIYDPYILQPRYAERGDISFCEWLSKINKIKRGY